MCCSKKTTGVVSIYSIYQHRRFGHRAKISSSSGKEMVIYMLFLIEDIIVPPYMHSPCPPVVGVVR